MRKISVIQCKGNIFQVGVKWKVGKICVFFNRKLAVYLRSSAR